MLAAQVLITAVMLIMAASGEGKPFDDDELERSDAGRLRAGEITQRRAVRIAQRSGIHFQLTSSWSGVT